MNGRFGIIGLLAVCWGGLCCPPLDAQERDRAEVQLQTALHAEEVEGDLTRAITLYKEIVARYAGERDVAARALFYLGRSYEKLGSQEATSAYQRVVRDYGEQSEVAAQARARLAALQAPAPVVGRGPVARRLLSGDDTDINNLLEMVPSPDGHRVAYVDLYVGALHLRDLGTGKEEELLPGLPIAWNWAPVWSPDGTRIAFLKADRDSAPGGHHELIQVLDLATRSVTTVPGTEVTNPSGGMIGMMPRAWSRDGRLLLYGRPNGPGEIGLLPVEGGERRVLADSGSGASLSPDGRFVAYASGPSKNEQVFVQPVAGGSRRPITDAPGGNTDPLWSPDGSAIAYQRPDGVWVVPIVNGNVAGTPQLRYASTVSRMPQAWIEAGGLYLAQINDALVPLQATVDTVTGVAGAVEELPDHPPLATLFAWSPDRQRIAFVVGNETWQSNNPAIVTQAADGASSSSYRVTEAGESIAQIWWSGDGREIVFRSNVRATGTAVRALDPATGRVRDLAPRSRDRALYHRSADGRRMVFWDWAREKNDSALIGWVVAQAGESEGRVVVPLKDADGVMIGYVVQLSPTGDRLLFTRQKPMQEVVTGQAGTDPGTLWVVASDGSDIARRIGATQMIGSAVWDPSGRFVAYTAAVNNATTVVRIVEVATGTTHEVPLPKDVATQPVVTDWSRDGRLGIVAHASRWEYWAIQGLVETAR